eukprot:150368-Prymnesium_polylepis.1
MASPYGRPTAIVASRSTESVRDAVRSFPDPPPDRQFEHVPAFSCQTGQPNGFRRRAAVRSTVVLFWNAFSVRKVGVCHAPRVRRTRAWRR